MFLFLSLCLLEVRGICCVACLLCAQSWKKAEWDRGVRSGWLSCLENWFWSSFPWRFLFSHLPIPESADTEPETCLESSSRSALQCTTIMCILSYSFLYTGLLFNMPQPTQCWEFVYRKPLILWELLSLSLIFTLKSLLFLCSFPVIFMKSKERRKTTAYTPSLSTIVSFLKLLVWINFPGK